MGKRKKIKVLETIIEGESEERQKGEIKLDRYLLSETDLVTMVKKINSAGEIIRVVNVSYSIQYENKWIVIVRFDDFHGFLHRHTRISLENPGTIDESINIIKRGSPKKWLSWAAKYLNKNFYGYKVGFARRSKINILDLL